MNEPSEMEPAADSFAPEDFGMGQLCWEIRDAIVVGDAETGRIVLWDPAARQVDQRSHEVR